MAWTAVSLALPHPGKEEQTARASEGLDVVAVVAVEEADLEAAESDWLDAVWGAVKRVVGGVAE